MTILGWTLARPFALGALLLPLAVVLLSMRRERPRTVVIGTARFFESGDAAESARRRRRLSGARLAAILAMILGTFVAAAPRPVPGERPPEVFVAYVDRSPSTTLPIDPADPDGRRRIDVSVAAALDWFRARAGSDRSVEVLVRWVDASSVAGGSAPAIPVDADPPAWVGERPVVAAAEPAWGALDAPGALFLTDAVDGAPRRTAGVFASGGAKVPGPVALGTEGLLVWTGDDAAPLEPASGAARGPTIRITPEVPDLVAAFGRVWAEERGVRETDDAGDAGLVVRVRAAGAGGERRTIRAGRDGWSAEVVVDGDAVLAAGDSPWLVSTDGVPLVGWAPGAVDLLFSGIASPPSDPAAFAVSWTALLDAAFTPPPDVVPIDERRAAGAARTVEPDLAEMGAGAADVDAARRAERGRFAELVLAAAAAAFALLALVLRSRGSA